MATQDNTIRLKIFGEEYTVRSKADPAYLQNVADYVDKHMREIASNLPSNQPALRIAVLAAMNITDEVFELRNQLDEVKQSYDIRTDELVEFIENKLEKHSNTNTPSTEESMSA